MDFMIESRAQSIRDGGSISGSCGYGANIGGGGGGGEGRGVMKNAYHINGMSYGGSSCSSTTTTNSSSSSSDLGIHSKVTEDSIDGAHQDESFYQNNANLLKLAYTHNHHHDTEMISPSNNIYLNYHTSNHINQNQNNHHDNHSSNFNDMGGGLGFPPFKSSPVPSQYYHLPGACGWQYSKNHLINPPFEYSNATTGYSFFTSEQWLEFTQQTYIFKHFTAGVAPPAALLLPIINTLALATMMHTHTSPPTPPFNHLFGGGVLGGFNLGLMRGGSVDPEPGRCRRTDGKKWRCARDVMPDQKYCERHMHRGRHRARAASASKLSNNPNPNPNPNPNDASFNPLTTTTTNHTDTTNPAAPNPNPSVNPSAHPQASMSIAAPLSSSPLLAGNGGGHALPMPSNTSLRSGIHPQVDHFSPHSSNGVSSNPGTTNHVPNRCGSDHQAWAVLSSSSCTSSRASDSEFLSLEGTRAAEELKGSSREEEGYNYNGHERMDRNLLNAHEMGTMKGNSDANPILRPFNLSEMLRSSPNPNDSTDNNMEFISSFPGTFMNTNTNPYSDSIISRSSSASSNLEENLVATTSGRLIIPWLEGPSHPQELAESKGGSLFLYNLTSSSSTGLSNGLLSISMAKCGGNGEHHHDGGIALDMNINKLHKNHNHNQNQNHSHNHIYNHNHNHNQNQNQNQNQNESHDDDDDDDVVVVGGPLAEVLQTNNSSNSNMHDEYRKKNKKKKKKKSSSSHNKKSNGSGSLKDTKNGGDCGGSSTPTSTNTSTNTSANTNTTTTTTTTITTNSSSFGCYSDNSSSSGRV